VEIAAIFRAAVQRSYDIILMHKLVKTVRRHKIVRPQDIVNAAKESICSVTQLKFEVS
jgi:hypothetical protein